MRTVFVDANYWVALANPRDQLHATAIEAAQTLDGARLVTTDEVLVEFLNFFCKKGELLRSMAVQFVQSINQNPNITVVPQTRETFQKGLRHYQLRLDKDYSMADCVSMATMRERNLQEVLTHDHHFTQEGFVVLLADESR